MRTPWMTKLAVYAILVAGGASKVNAIYGALRGKYGNTLVTDQITAKALLKKSDL